MVRKKSEDVIEEEEDIVDDVIEDDDDAPDSDEETEADEDFVSEEDPPMEETATVDEGADDRMPGLAADVPVQVVAVLGKRSFNMQDLMKFHVGQVVDLYRPANETVDLVVGGKLIAKGELVSIDGKLGVRIVKLV